jgi:hypothetical protein
MATIRDDAPRRDDDVLAVWIDDGQTGVDDALAVLRRFEVEAWLDAVENAEPGEPEVDDE